MWKAEVDLTPLIVRRLLKVVDHIVQDCLSSIMKMTMMKTTMMVITVVNCDLMQLFFWHLYRC